MERAVSRDSYSDPQNQISKFSMLEFQVEAMDLNVGEITPKDKKMKSGYASIQFELKEMKQDKKWPNR